MFRGGSVRPVPAVKPRNGAGFCAKTYSKHRHVVFTIDEGLWDVFLLHRKLLKEYMDEAVRIVKTMGGMKKNGEWIHPVFVVMTLITLFGCYWINHDNPVSLQISSWLWFVVTNPRSGEPPRRRSRQGDGAAGGAMKGIGAWEKALQRVESAPQQLAVLRAGLIDDGERPVQHEHVSALEDDGRQYAAGSGRHAQPAFAFGAFRFGGEDVDRDGFLLHGGSCCRTDGESLRHDAVNARIGPGRRQRRQPDALALDGVLHGRRRGGAALLAEAGRYGGQYGREQDGKQQQHPGTPRTDRPKP
jgi:hypothetical protein